MLAKTQQKALKLLTKCKFCDKMEVWSLGAGTLVNFEFV